MANRRKAVAAVAKNLKTGKRSGLARFVTYLEPRQLAELAAEARRRADERGAVRADVSSVIREAVDGWISKRR